MTTLLKPNRTPLLRAMAVAVAVLLPIDAAYAQPPEIVKVEVNAAAQTVSAMGHDFGSTTGRVALVGSRGSVDVELIVAAWSNEQVDAYLPQALPAGTYRLAIATHGAPRASGASDIIDVSFVPAPVARVEAGPAGPAGAAGAAGPVGPAGTVGPAGPQGPMGDGGPRGPIGPGFQWRGSWDPGVQYSNGDVVEHAGASYLAPEPIFGAEPAASPWQLMAAAGRDGAAGSAGPAGADGTTGPQGATGPAGPTGSQGATGPAGPTGPQGATGPAGDTGAVGSPGPMGPAGPQGSEGPAATSGVTAVLLATTVLDGPLQIVPASVTMGVPAGVNVSALVNAEGDIASKGGLGTQV